MMLDKLTRVLLVTPKVLAAAASVQGKVAPSIDARPLAGYQTKPALSGFRETSASPGNNVSQVACFGDRKGRRSLY